jgi:hypothetical protein
MGLSIFGTVAMKAKISSLALRPGFIT